MITQTEEEFWKEDADRLNLMSGMAKQSGAEVEAPGSNQPEELNEDGTLVGTPEEPIEEEEMEEGEEEAPPATNRKPGAFDRWYKGRPRRR